MKKLLLLIFAVQVCILSEAQVQIALPSIDGEKLISSSILNGNPEIVAKTTDYDNAIIPVFGQVKNLSVFADTMIFTKSINGNIMEKIFHVVSKDSSGKPVLVEAYKTHQLTQNSQIYSQTSYVWDGDEMVGYRYELLATVYPYEEIGELRRGTFPNGEFEVISIIYNSGQGFKEKRYDSIVSEFDSQGFLNAVGINFGVGFHRRFQNVKHNSKGEIGSYIESYYRPNSGIYEDLYKVENLEFGLGSAYTDENFKYLYKARFYSHPLLSPFPKIAFKPTNLDKYFNPPYTPPNGWETIAQTSSTFTNNKVASMHWYDREYAGPEVHDAEIQYGSNHLPSQIITVINQGNHLTKHESFSYDVFGFLSHYNLKSFSNGGLFHESDLKVDLVIDNDSIIHKYKTIVNSNNKETIEEYIYKYNHIKPPFSSGLKILVFPNPAVDEDLTIQSNADISNVEIFSQSGLAVTQQKPQTPTKNVEVKNPQLAPGIYFIRVTTAQGVEFQKLMVR